MIHPKQQYDATFIVRACTSHASLVAALEGMARLAETEAAAGSSAWRKAAILARQVLAEAEKT